MIHVAESDHVIVGEIVRSHVITKLQLFVYVQENPVKFKLFITLPLHEIATISDHADIDILYIVTAEFSTMVLVPVEPE